MLDAARMTADRSWSCPGDSSLSAKRLVDYGVPAFASFVSRRMFYGWWIAFACASCILLTGGTFYYGFGLLVNPLEDEFGWSRAAVSVGFSLRTEVGGVAAPLVGVLVDRVGARILMVSGTFIVAAGFIALGLVGSLLAFYGAIVLIAIGMSATLGGVPNVIVTHWFRRKRGRALGIMGLGGGVSGVVTIFFAWLIGQYGWRDAVIITGVLQLTLTLPFLLSIRNRPEDMGLQPDGEEVADSRHVETQRPADSGMTAKEALRSSVFWRVSLAFALANFTTTAVIVHQVPYLTGSAGMSDATAAGSITALTLLSILGRVGLGAASDYVSTKAVMGFCLLCIGIASALFITVSEVWQLAYVLPLFALGHGGLVPVRSMLQAEYYGLRAFGSIQGLQLTVSTFGAFLGPILAGYLYDSVGNYQAAFLMLGFVPMAGIPLVLSTRKPRWSEDSPAGEYAAQVEVSARD